MDGESITPQADDKYSSVVLGYCKIPRSRDEIQAYIQISDREHFRLSILQPLLLSGKLLPTIPDKPTSPKQKYYTNL